MATTADYLTQLQADKQMLVDNLVTKGVEATSDETFTSLVPKVADIPSGASFEITDCYYLFATNARTNVLNELCALISSSCERFSYMFATNKEITTIPEFNTSNGTNFERMYYNSSIQVIPLLDTKNGENFSYLCYGCSSLTSFPQINTGKGKNLNSMFLNCTPLTTIPELDFSSANDISSILISCRNVTTLGGFKNLGKAYLTNVNTNYGAYRLDLSSCSKLSYDSLINVINNLYDIASSGVQPQQLVLGATNLAKLTEEEISLAQVKGWNVS